MFLADQSLKFLETEPAEWIHRKVVDLDVGTIHSVALYRGNTADPVYRLERQQGDAGFALTAAAVSGPVETGKVDRVVEALSPLRTEDVLPAENPGRDISFENADRFEFRTEDGWRYTIRLGPSFSRRDETYTYARLEKLAPKTKRRRQRRRRRPKKQAQSSPRAMNWAGGSMSFPIGKTRISSAIRPNS